MSGAIHVPLAALLPGASGKENPRASSLGGLRGGRTFYIETFGCQMNEHDSEKVAGVLLRRGYRQVVSPDEARLVFYNTCSIREKAAQKVFSRLGEFNPKNNSGRDSGKVIGVLGCVAQQEGEQIFERAPWVSLVCGSASYRKLPLLLARLEAGERRVTGLETDTDETFETELTRRDHPFRAYLTIIEGCDKACSYCVVPYTREEYLEKIGLIRRARRPISITTDIIVGFPGESEQDFEETLSLLDAAQFDGAFSFQYSPRPHTPAAVMADPVPEGEKLRRLQALQERQRAIQLRRNQCLVGEVFEVLVEGASRRETQWTGRTSSNRVLNFTSSCTDLLGEYVRVRVTGAGPNSLTGAETCALVPGREAVA